MTLGWIAGYILISLGVMLIGVIGASKRGRIGMKKLKKLKRMNLKKGDVFRDKKGKEFMFIGWMHGADAFTGRTAKCTAYRSKMYAGIVAIQEGDMTEHGDWISGFMAGEGT